jgi:hypothetical protein
MLHNIMPIICDTQSPAESTHLVRMSINPLTCLSTDFLNHFNEAHMILEMLPDWPDMFEDLRHWQPRSYEEHFKLSGFSDADIIIEAYWQAPQIMRYSFDSQTDALSHVMSSGIRALEHVWDLSGPVPTVFSLAATLSCDIRVLLDRLATTINIGCPSEIAEVDVEISGMDHNDIDALFA